MLPGETIETTQEFYLPTNGLNDHVYAKVIFQKGSDASYPLEPIEVQMDIKEAPKPLSVSKTVEKDGIKFDVTFSSVDFQSNGELTAKIKATNISEEAIPYVMFDGCDRGVKTTIFADDNGVVFIGHQKPNGLTCIQAGKYSTLAPGKTIEATQEFFLPKNGLNDHVYAKVTFQKKE